MEEPNQAKKLLIDTTFLFDQYSKRGIGMYGKNVIKRLIELNTIEDNLRISLIGFSTLSNNLRELGFTQFEIEEVNSKVDFISLGKTFNSTPRNIYLWQKFYIPHLNELKPDLFFSVQFERGLPTTDLINSNLKYKPKTLIMAHDAIPIALNQYSQKNFIINILKGLFYKIMWSGIQKADKVLTNSNFSKEDLIKFGHIDENKIKVIYLGVDAGFFRENYVENENTQSILDNFGVRDQKYFIYDTGLESNKGINGLLKLMKEIFEQNDKVLPDKLVVIGNDLNKGIGHHIVPKTRQGERFLKECKRLNILDNIIATSRITDQHLKLLFLNASVYINLSKYEGFSFGPIQAMAAKVPAIALNASCVPEITKGGAYLIDREKLDLPILPKEFVDELMDYLKNKTKLKKVLENACIIAKEYDWDETAKLTYQEILNLAK